MPKNPKISKKCDNCGKIFKHLKKYTGRCKQFEGKRYCGICYKKIPRNPFFVEVKDRPSYNITKFSLSTDEKKMIHTNYIKNGYTYDKAWHKINILCQQMRFAKMRKAKAFKQQKQMKGFERAKSDSFKKSFETLANS